MKKKDLRNTILLLGGIFILIVILIFVLNTQNSYDLQSNAQEEDPNFCQNHCKDPTCRSLPDFYDASCCEEIQKTGDPFACPWPQRGWCMPEHCASIPEGVIRQRCAGPRESWCNLCKEKKCPGFVVAPFSPTRSPSPKPTVSLVAPTKPAPLPSLLAPTAPQKEPTSLLRSPPNEGPKPIINNTFQESRPESVSQQFGFPSIQFPNINLPKVNINLVKINQGVRKPLGFFEYLFRKIVYYDNLLENTINAQVNKITK